MQHFVEEIAINESNKFWIELNGDKRLMPPKLFARINNIYDRLISGAKFSITANGSFDHTSLWKMECDKLQCECNDALDFLSSFPDQEDKFVTKLTNTYSDYLREIRKMNVDLLVCNRISAIDTI
jgi:hypothetical protein